MNRIDPSSERGIAMIVVLMVLIAGTMLGTVALSAAGADLPFSRQSQDRKQAYAAAEAGAEYYLYQLSQDNDYWTRCTSVPAPNPTEPSPVNQKWNGSGADPRVWRNVPGSKARYTIEVLPVTNGVPCAAGDAESTLLDKSSGTFRIRTTGDSNGIKRSTVIKLRRRSFLDFLYVTDLETSDPATYATDTARTWAAANCVQPRGSRDSNCDDIQFSGTDAIRGPFHTNDDILTCGATTLGRTKADMIEISGNAGWTTAPGCSGSPNILGTLQSPIDSLPIPASNLAIAAQAPPAYSYTGKTTIRLTGATMDVTTGSPPSTSTLPLPPNGVIYVNGACASSQTPLLQSYTDAAGCANVYVSGTYSKSLTIASANDIIIQPPAKQSNGDIRRDGDVVLGLIANNFVRVAHPVTRSNPDDPNNCTNDIPPNQLSMPNVTIDAAILSLKHSFIVDNYRCGAALGTLTVTGAIAQKFRGPVGTTRPTGYTKNYVYDDRLKFRSPPYFLDPVSAAWKVSRVNEQVPATG